MRLIFLSFSFLMVQRLVAQPTEWIIDPTQFENSMTLTWKFEFPDNEELEEADYMAAFIGEELRGVSSAMLNPVLEEYFFLLIVYSDVAFGETIHFKYYDASRDSIFSLDRTFKFISGVSEGSFSNPIPLHLGSTPQKIRSGNPQLLTRELKVPTVDRNKISPDEYTNDTLVANSANENNDPVLLPDPKGSVVKVYDSVSAKPITIMVYNEHGKLVKQKDKEHVSTQVGELGQGVYFIEISSPLGDSLSQVSEN